jgi:hypothetical protein
VHTRTRELLADWLIVAGGVALLTSLFMTWSHQFSPAFLVQFGSSSQLRDLPRNPTAWQVYSAADVVLALLAIGLIVIALVGSRSARIAALVAASIGLAFTLHALSAPPSNGANIFDPSLSPPGYFPSSPGAGAGVTVAIAGLGVALAGLALSFSAD